MCFVKSPVGHATMVALMFVVVLVALRGMKRLSPQVGGG